MERATGLGDAFPELVPRQEQRGLHGVEHPCDLGVAGLVVDRDGDRTELPARAVELADLGPVRGLPGHDAPTTDARGAQRTGERRRPAAQQRVERGDVPRASRRAVLRSARVAVGAAQSAQRSGVFHASPTGVMPRTRFDPMKLR
jgi:hypothetical protein